MGHRYWFGHPVPAPNLSIPLGSLPSGQLISCAEDMAHYLIAHLNVLLYNANHAIVKMTFDEFGLGAAQRLAGEFPSQTLFGAAPWLMRGMALIPILQVADVVSTLRQLNRWRLDPGSRPSRGRLWGHHILLPLILSLLVSLTLVPMLSKMRGWISLFMPDFSWIARVCGGFATIWSFLRTGLILQSNRKHRPAINTRSSAQFRDDCPSSSAYEMAEKLNANEPL
jgi:hypothetical protein